MPKMILGKPVDESKWEKAKQLAADEGRAEDYAYITGIYKKMTKSGADLLELSKARRGMPVGTRKAYKRTQAGKMVWMWFKKNAQGKWDYDGMVSSGERETLEAIAKKKESLKKMKAGTKKKAAELKAKKEAKDKSDSGSDGGGDGTPTPQQIASMPKKEQLYWDKDTTDRARRLCDLSGVLCTDKESEDYVEDNLNNVFKMDASQKKDLKNMGSTYPVDTDGKAFNDPLFVQETLENMRALQKQMLGKPGYPVKDSYRKKIIAKMKADGISTDDTTVQAHVDNMRDAVNNWIDALEKHENDKIVLGKMRSLEKGLRGMQVANELPSALIGAVLPVDYPYADAAGGGDRSSGTWDELKPEMRQFLKYIGLDRTKHDARSKWIAQNMRQLALAAFSGSVSDELKPWFEGRLDPMDSNRYQTGGANVDTHASYYGTNPQTEWRSGDPEYWSYDDFLQGSVQWADQYGPIQRIIGKQVFINNPGMPDEINSDIGAMWDSGYYRSQGKTELSMNTTMTWRELGNELKNAMRNKTVNWSNHQETFDAIKDTARALGGTTLHNSASEAHTKLQAMHDTLSEFQKGSLSYKEDYVTQNLPEIMGGQGRSRYGSTSHQKMTMGRPNGPSEFGQYIHYKVFSRDKEYGGRWQRRSKLEKFDDTKLLKNALRSKFAVNTIIAPGRYSYNINTANNHAQQAIAYGIGMNWQIRKLAKKSKLIPNWKWGDFTPYAAKNPLNSGGVISNPQSYYASSQTAFGPEDFQKKVTEARQNSIAANIGLVATVPTGKKSPPKIVLRTNQQGTSWWNQKMQDDWTHKSTGAHAYAKDSMKVNNVFDIMYHDYYGDYKEREQAIGNVQYAYHGTDFEAGAKIIKGGYKVFPRGAAKTGRSLGDGLYVAKSSSKVGGYFMSGGWGRSGHGVMFWNRIAMGKTTDGTGSSYSDDSYDTIYSKRFQHDEWCIRNKDRKAGSSGGTPIESVVPIQWIDVGPA